MQRLEQAEIVSVHTGIISLFYHSLEFIHYVSTLDTVTPSLDNVTAAIGLHQKHGFGTISNMAGEA